MTDLKEAVVTRLAGRFRESGAVVVTEYRGLTTAEMAALRSSLRDCAAVTVTKNTLARRAAVQAGLGGVLGPLLHGPTALALVSGDAALAARGLRDFARARPLLVIRGGVLDGREIPPGVVTELAALGSREALLARAAAMMKAPAGRMAAALAALRDAGRATGMGRERDMPGMSSTDLLEAFKEMTLLELSAFVKEFEEMFGVSAAIPATVTMTGQGDDGSEAPAEEEQDEFDVILMAAGDKKIQVIKEVRSLTSLGLKEAKDLVDGAPRPVAEKVGKAAAEKARNALEGAGATVEVR